MHYQYLLNQRVRVISGTLNAPHDYGILIRIETGSYPYIIQFDNGNVFGVNKIEEMKYCDCGMMIIRNSDVCPQCGLYY